MPLIAIVCTICDDSKEFNIDEGDLISKSLNLNPVRQYLMEDTSWSKGALQWIIEHHRDNRRGGMDGHTPFDVKIGEMIVGNVDGHNNMFGLTIFSKK